MDSYNYNRNPGRGLAVRGLLLAVWTACGVLAAAAAHGGLRGAATPVAPQVANAPLDQIEKLYIVQLKSPPALGNAEVAGRQVVREGLLAGAVKRNRFDRDAAVTRNYVRRIEAEQQAILQSLNLDGEELHSYRYAFNGFAVSMTPGQARRLRLHKQVANVWEDRRRRVSTSDSPAFLGLLSPTTGLRTANGLQGTDVIIGVIDSGITPGHPSFAERAPTGEMPRICKSDWGENSLLGLWLCRRFKKPGPVLYSEVPERWNGACETGPNFTVDDCNRKLIGARFYNAGFLLEDRFSLDPNEFASPADADGHGTHIASIAAGNEVEADIFGRDIGTISGMAPRARIAVYKACWLEPGGFRATCSVADLQAAIDDAVADGVDIINYSVGSLDDSLTDPDDIALLRATEQGILSIVATGNDGPTPFTLQAPATTPWVLSVAASSRAGTRVAEAVRVNAPEAVAADYESKEAAFTPLLRDVGPVIEELVLVDDGTVTTPEGETGTTYDACSPLINQTDIANKIAFIQRGGCDFRDKIVNAQNAGAVAVVVFSNDNPLQFMSGDSTGIVIPAVMIGQADGQLLRDRLALDETIEIRLDKELFIDLNEAGNIMGSFSGRGPSLADPDFLKPDVTAPGVRILGAQTPDVANSFRGEMYQYLSGTSQSAPHVAGIAALLKQANPDWTPAELKSALMTSARQNIVKTAGGAAADPFDMGAGHIVPNAALNPGLVYPADVREYDSYLCNVGLARLLPLECAQLVVEGFDLDAADINLPSIALTELVATRDVTRTVRNAGPAAIFQVEVDAPDGVDVTVTPATLSLMPDESADFTVSFAANGARLNEWQFGSYTWVGDGQRVYSPFAVQPTELGFSADVFGNDASGSATVEIQFGYTGNYSADVSGLELPCVLPDNNLNDDICSNSQPQVILGTPVTDYSYLITPTANIVRFTVQRDLAAVPVADRDYYARFALFDELTDGDDDLDMYVYDCVDEIPVNNPDGVCEDLVEVGFSQNAGTSDEVVEDFTVRGQGSYIIDVHAWDVDGSNDDGVATAQFCLLAWSVGPDSNAGNLTLSNVPAGATYGTSASYTANWNALEDGLWLGAINHERDGTRVGFTLADINVNGLPQQTPGNFACP